MSDRPALRDVIPQMAAHEGVWEGSYRRLDSEGALLDVHRSQVRCIFPDSGPWDYVQQNHFIWPDGRERRVELHGRLVGQRVHWDTDTFSGYGWGADDGVVLLNLERKDVPGAHFLEVILLGEGGGQRARTWHWFRDGRCYQRTLCDEWRVSGQASPMSA